MTGSVPRDVLNRVRKLAQLPEEVRQSRWAVSITRLTVLKSLCQTPEVAHRFVTYLARKMLERIERGQGRSSHQANEEQRGHQELMADALVEMEAWIEEPTEDRRRTLTKLLGRMQAEQNEFKWIKGNLVRIIRDSDLVLFEEVLECLLRPDTEAGSWAYQVARVYTERYEPSAGTGLIAASVPMVQDVVDFWIQECGLDPAGLTAQEKPGKGSDVKPMTGVGKGAARTKKAGKPAFTPRQGQFLAFIHLYRKLHHQGPAEMDMVRYFRLTPPSVHGMVVKLERLGLITREPGVARSARVAIPEAEIPPLDDVQRSPG